MPTELEINISPIFSTPLLVFTPASHKRINAELSQKILEREASVPTYSDYEVVGWSSPHDLTMLDWAGEALRELFTPVIEVAKQVTAFSERSGHSSCTRLASGRSLGQRTTNGRQQRGPFSSW